MSNFSVILIIILLTTIIISLVMYVKNTTTDEEVENDRSVELPELIEFAEWEEEMEEIITGSDVPNNEGEEQLNRLLNKDKYKLVDAHNIKLFPAVQATMFEPTNEVKTEGKQYGMYTISNSENKALAIKVTIAGLYVRIVLTEFLDIDDHHDNEKMYELNNYLSINKQINAANVKWEHLTRLDKVHIATMTTNGQSIVIESKISMPINVPVAFKNKSKVMTIGIIVTLLIENDCIWLGSIVKTKEMIYIVVDTIVYDSTDAIKLLCVAPIPHKYMIDIIQRNENN